MRYVAAHLDSRSPDVLAKYADLLALYAKDNFEEITEGNQRVSIIALSPFLVAWYLRAMGHDAYEAIATHGIGAVRYVLPSAWQRNAVTKVGSIAFADPELQGPSVIGRNQLVHYSDENRVPYLAPWVRGSREWAVLDVLSVNPTCVSLVPEGVYNSVKEAFCFRGYTDRQVFGNSDGVIRAPRGA